jgi:Cu/Zn superoxide dismutase
VRRITKAALGGLAGFGLILGATLSANGASTTAEYSGDLVDLQTLAGQPDGPFDSAKARVVIEETLVDTEFSIRVTSINSAVPGHVFGAHLHTGPCVEGDGAAAGPHYNTDLSAGVKLKKAEISPETEVWFALAPDEEGMAFHVTTVPFAPVDSDGIMSVVFHALSTDPTTGAAGARQACVPLSVPGWQPGA